jgi:ribosomal protein L37AE/L43A
VNLKQFGIRLPAGSGRPEQLPYRQRDDFPSAAELPFYRVLMLALDGSHLVCPKVNSGDIFFVARPNENLSFRNKIDRKHVDSLLCDPATMKPIMGVEMDDENHARRDRQDRDEFVAQVFEAAGLPLLHVRAAASYSPQNIADLVRRAISGRAIPEKVIANQADTPTCPKCGTPMVLRTAKKGNQKGEDFWGCKNHPQCRETAGIWEEVYR